MKKVYIVCMAVFLIASFSSFHKLKRVRMSDRITVALPLVFSPMTDEDLLQRFPSVRQPLGAYTNTDQTAHFIAKISATQWPDKNLSIAKDFFKASIQNWYNRVDWIHSDVRTIHHKKYIYFAFESTVSDLHGDVLQQYTCIQYLLDKQSALTFTFTCLLTEKENWEQTADAIMHSLRVK